MSQLDELEKKIFEKKQSEELERRASMRVILEKPSENISPSWKEEVPKKTDEPRTPLQKNFLRIVIGGLLALGIAGAAVLLFLYFGIRGKEIEIAIGDVGDIKAGELVRIPVHFKNISRSTLKDVELALIVPSDSLVRDAGVDIPAPPRFTHRLDDLPAGQDKTFELETVFFGKERDTKDVQAILRYRSESFRAIFSARAYKAFTIGAVPLRMSIEMPETLADGQEIELVVRYTSDAEKEFKNLAVRMEYPQGFLYGSADPGPVEENKIWRIGNVARGESGEIRIKGKITGREGELKPFRAELGIFNALTKEWKSYSETIKEAKIAVRPLSVQGTIADARDAIVTPGDGLLFLIKYKNNTAFTMKNVTVRASVADGYSLSTQAPRATANLVRFETITSEGGGVFDQLTRMVVWGPAQVPSLRELRPGDEGIVRFRMSTRDTPLVRSVADKDLSIRLVSRIDAADFPQEFLGTKIGMEDSVDFKVRTKTSFVGKSLFRSSNMVNSGPIPPKVGKKTSYTIVWEIKNFTSELKNTEVRGALPPNVVWEQSVVPPNTSVHFEESSSEVVWRIGSVPAGTGVVSPTLVVAFKVSITPSETDIGGSVILVSSSKLTAEDSFIGEKIEITHDKLSTQVYEDTTVSGSDWAVVK